MEKNNLALAFWQRSWKSESLCYMKKKIEFTKDANRCALFKDKFQMVNLDLSTQIQYHLDIADMPVLAKT